MNRDDELKHFGVKGMRWGVWNEETRARRSGAKREKGSYRRGKKIYDERNNYYKKAESKLKKKYDSEITKLWDEAIAIANKYELDQDDGGGGNTEKYSDKELRKAGKAYMNKWDEIERLNEQIQKESNAITDKYISDKYGNIAIKDIQRYEDVQNLKVVAVLFGTPFAAIGAYYLMARYS